jgi:DNA/RNA-binding domain of Phe-tRNA-synthetase-like protein
VSTLVVGGVSVRVEVAGPAGIYGVVVARGCTVAPSSGEVPGSRADGAVPPLSAGPGPQALTEALDAAVAEAAGRPEGDAVTRAVRDLLRYGRYKPTGRGKPASEYLVKAAVEGRFPRINTLVDINNLVSLQSDLPISLVDLARAGTDAFVLRRGRAGEAYVFNAAGQTIDVEDLLVVARLPADEACANPVKDSMATKLGADARDVMAVLYAPVGHAEVLVAATRRFEAALVAWGGAAEAASGVILGG